MSVYVDNAKISFGRMKMSHMLADSRAELLAMARKIGLASRHIQNEGMPGEHFDVSSSYRMRALREGAVEINQRDLVKLIRSRRTEETFEAYVTGSANVPDPEPDPELEPEPATPPDVIWGNDEADTGE